MKAVDELRTIMDILKADGLDKKVRIDFSIVNDMNYYSGVLFKGFVKRRAEERAFGRAVRQADEAHG
jgi:ATP phosphoribosyltransferase regulatory subunit